MTPSQFRALPVEDIIDMMAHDITFAKMEAVEVFERDKEFKKK